MKKILTKIVGTLLLVFFIFSFFFIASKIQYGFIEIIIATLIGMIGIALFLLSYRLNKLVEKERRID